MFKTAVNLKVDYGRSNHADSVVADVLVDWDGVVLVHNVVNSLRRHH
jgi:hypothetical protein